jgi:UDP-hydrolysing UDP-N-acetyl-D-glucosamine 2-epimerase
MHPVTLDYDNTGVMLEETLGALEDTGMNLVFTYPNADTRGRQIIAAIEAFSAGSDKARCLVNLGTQGYFSLMAHASAMVGNSSSGIIEAASFRLPVVNIGMRQRGRIHAVNVIDVPGGRAAIRFAILEALSEGFAEKLRGLVNPYGDGHASERIVERIRNVPLDKSLLIKKFHDQQPALEFASI